MCRWKGLYCIYSGRDVPAALEVNNPENIAKQVSDGVRHSTTMHTLHKGFPPAFDSVACLGLLGFARFQLATAIYREETSDRHGLGTAIAST